MTSFWKNASILKKILAGIGLASLFLLIQLIGVFYSNSLSVKRLNLVNDIQKASVAADRAEELIDVIHRISHQLPKDRSDILGSETLTRQNLAVLQGLMRSLQSRLKRVGYTSPLLEEATAALAEFTSSTIAIFQAALAPVPSSTILETEQALTSQYRVDLKDIIAKINLDLADRSKELINLMFTARYRPLYIGGLLTLVFLVATLLGGGLFFRGFSASIRNLKTATAKISAGDLGYQAPVLNQDEIGDLTRSFNQMAATVQESTVSKEYVDSVLESLPDPLILTSPEGQITGSNKALAALAGVSAESVKGGRIEELFEDFQPEFLTVSSTETRFFENRLKTSFDGSIPVFCSAGALIGKSHEVETRIFVVKDISELARLKDELEKKNKDLSAANKELESFSYSVSHDLRAPLRSIDGFSSTLLRKNAQQLDERGKDYLSRIRESTQRMATLIDDLLNFSRLGRTALTKQNMNISEIVWEKIREIEALEPDRKVQWVVEPNVFAQVDPQLIRVVLDNLLSNSWKFTSHHDSARIEFGQTQADGERAFFVKDDGAGFDMQYVSKLFAPFQRLHGAKEFPGTGIGLALINRVIHRHGGRVWAQGGVEKGATIFFTLGEDVEV